ncbi:MAG: hypothetical protein ACLPY5_00315 [Candidatus Bathyarchaeia archaeon]
MSANKHLAAVLLRAVAVLSLSALAMTIALNLTDLQDALLIFVIAAPIIVVAVSLIFAKLGIDSLFSRKTESASQNSHRLNYLESWNRNIVGSSRNYLITYLPTQHLPW